MKIHVTLHAEDGQFWAEVREFPGCFAAGSTLEELTNSLNEALELCLADAPEKRNPIRPSMLDFSLNETVVLNATA